MTRNKKLISASGVYQKVVFSNFGPSLLEVSSIPAFHTEHEGITIYAANFLDGVLASGFGRSLASVIWTTLEFSRATKIGSKNPIEYLSDMKGENLKVCGKVFPPFIGRLLYFAQLPGPATAWKQNKNFEFFRLVCLSIVINSFRLFLILGNDPTDETLKLHDALWKEVKTLWNRLFPKDMGLKLKMHIPIHYSIKSKDKYLGGGKASSLQEQPGEKDNQKCEEFCQINTI